MLTKLVKVQLVLFAAVTVVALVVMSLFYIKLPEQLGIGRFEVTVELDDAGGLYERSLVTYRGSEVGVVTQIRVNPGKGIRAKLKINDGARIPADSTVLVRSASIIGEQYIDFVPRAEASREDVIEAGDVITSDSSVLPTTTDEVLNSVDAFVRSLPAESLDATLDELGTAFDGTGEDLGLAIDSFASFLDEATATLPETVSLIDAAEPVLRTQTELQPQLSSLVNSLDGISAELERGEADFRTILDPQVSQRFLDSISGFADHLDPSLATVLDDLGSVGEVLDAYRPGLEHTLTVVPVLQHIVDTMELQRLDDENPAVNLWFKLGVDPPVCNYGFENAYDFLPPNGEVLGVAPADSYCKLPSDAPQVVRGSRNAPCPNDPSLRGAYASDCGLVFDQETVDEQNALRAKNDELLAAGGVGPVDGSNGFFVDVLETMIPEPLLRRLAAP